MTSIPKSKKEKMTLDKLAQMTADGFIEMGKRINKVEERTGRIENVVTGLKDEFNNLKSDVDKKIDYGINKILIVADNMAKQFSDWKQENAFGAGINKR